MGPTLTTSLQAVSFQLQFAKYADLGLVYEEAMAATTMVRPHLGRTLLGWHPVKASLVDGLETWYAAWKASAGL